MPASTIRVGVFQPFHYLPVGLRLFGSPHDLPVGLEHLPPERQLILCGVLRAKAVTPPVRKALQPRAFCRRQPPHDVVRLLLQIVDDGRVLVISSHQRVRQLLLRPREMGILAGAVGRLHYGVAVRCIQRERNILIDAAALRPVLIVPPDHGALQDEGLHLHIPGRHQCPGLPVQVDDLVPLVDVER